MKYSILFSFLLTCATLSAELPYKEGEFEILVQNRVMAQVNGKPITALDVIKRMDFLFYRQFPEYMSSQSARYQYYEMNFEPILQELIDRELMRADAAEMKVEILPSDVRQELETTFGPDIISNLDKIGLRLEEAMTMLKDELLIRRVTMYKVNGKAFRNVGPMEIKKAYEEWLTTHTEPQKWRYRLFTLRGPSEEEGKKAAALVREAILTGLDPETVRKEVIQEGLISPNITMTLSEVYTQPQEEVPDLLLPVLSKMDGPGVSEIFSQLSRKTGEVAVRLIVLEDKLSSLNPPLRDVEDRLKNDLLQRGAMAESQKYLSSLRDQYHVSTESRGLTGLPFMPIPK